MKRKVLLTVFVSVSLFSVMLGIVFMRPVKSHPADIIVPDDYEKIQWAIGNASDGKTIFVKAGKYYEHVVVNKNVTLIGENRSTTIIDGKGTEIVIYINAPDVEIRGFTVQNGGIWPKSGILLGICTKNIIRDNIIRNNAYGIELSRSNECCIIGNKIMNNSAAGIYILESSSNNDIHNNTIAKNSIGVLIPSEYSLNNTFYHNNFIENLGQAQSIPPTKWDNGTEGNFWSDYTGEDSDSDGIGDTEHYVYPGPGIDYYPLMSPFGDIEPPVAEAGPDQSVFQGTTVTFNGNESTDDIGIKNYTWNFTDITPKTLTGVHPTHRFKNKGNFTVTLNVTDYADQWDTDTMRVTVSEDNTKPSIETVAQEPEVPNDGENVTITVNVTDEESGVHNVTISYRTNSGPWTNVSMSKLTGDTWEGEIPGQPAGTNVTYKIIAYDNAGNFEVDPQLGQYHVYTVIPEFPATKVLPLFMIVTLIALILMKKYFTLRNKH